jgi:hypothetical protein
MKVVIDIPEDHKRVIDNLVIVGKGYLLPYEVEDTLAKAVKQSTPLPKGHGRLIDADELFWDIQTDEQMRLGEHLAWVKERIDDAPTIIEAESEVTE